MYIIGLNFSKLCEMAFSSSRSVTPENCVNLKPDQLFLKGDLSWGAEEQFENEALMAVRTANFISAFLQVFKPHHKKDMGNVVTRLFPSPGGGPQGGVPGHQGGGQAADGGSDDR